MVADVHVRLDNGFANPAVRADDAAICRGVGAWAVDEQLAELGRVLSKRVGARAAAMADQITAEVSFYREQRTVSPAELRKAALALTCHAAVPQCRHQEAKVLQELLGLL